LHFLHSCCLRPSPFAVLFYKSKNSLSPLAVVRILRLIFDDPFHCENESIVKNTKRSVDDFEMTLMVEHFFSNFVKNQKSRNITPHRSLFLVWQQYCIPKNSDCWKVDRVSATNLLFVTHHLPPWRSAGKSSRRLESGNGAEASSMSRNTAMTMRSTARLLRRTGGPKSVLLNTGKLLAAAPFLLLLSLCAPRPCRSFGRHHYHHHLQRLRLGPAFLDDDLVDHRIQQHANHDRISMLAPNHDDDDDDATVDPPSGDPRTTTSCSSSMMIVPRENKPNLLMMSRRAVGQRSLAAIIATAVTATATATATPASAAAAATADGSDHSDDDESVLIPTPATTSDVYWPLGKVAFSLLPLAGTYTRRKTVETVVVPDTIWTFDQIQGIVQVNVPVRQTVIKLTPSVSSGNGGAAGSLWVHNPVAPTPELIDMMHRLQRLQNATIQHIVLGTVALEHKATLGDFCRHFPAATVWIQPGQWSFPLQIPIEWLGGLPQRGQQLRELPVPQHAPTRPRYVYSAKAATAAAVNAAPVGTTTPLEDPVWKTEIEYCVLGPFQFKSVGAFSETAFYHKSTKTLLVTDVVCSVTADPPAIIQEDARALLFHCRDRIDEHIVADTPELRRKGWRHMVQFGLVFFPSQIEIVPRTVSQAIQDANRFVPRNLRNLGDGAVPFGGKLYPWIWNNNNASDDDKGDADLRNFNAISQNGKLFCPPILYKLILDREPQATLAWVDAVVTSLAPDMQRIIPSHLNNNIEVTIGNTTGKKKNALAQEFYEAFGPLRAASPPGPNKQQPRGPLAQDLALLQAASDILTKYGIVAPSQVCDGELARTLGRFAAS
jgi:Domain of unknown function (DUF4336)